MALTYTQTKSTLDLIADQSEKSRQSLQNLISELEMVIDILQNLETTYTAFVNEVDTVALANPTDSVWQHTKAEKDKIVQDFIAVRDTANNMLVALTGE